MKGFFSNQHKSSEHRIGTFLEMIDYVKFEDGSKTKPSWLRSFCTLIQNDDIFRLICKPLTTKWARFVALAGLIGEMVRYKNKIISEVSE